MLPYIYIYTCIQPAILIQGMCEAGYLLCPLLVGEFDLFYIESDDVDEDFVV